MFTYSLVLQPSDSLGFLYYGCQFFPIECFLSPSLKLYLAQILLHIFLPSQTRSSPSSTSILFTLKYFLNCPFLIHSYYTSNPFQSFLFNIYYCIAPSIPHQFLFSTFLALPLVHISFLMFSSPMYSVFSYPPQSLPMLYSQMLQLVTPSFYIP